MITIFVFIGAITIYGTARWIEKDHNFRNSLRADSDDDKPEEKKLSIKIAPEKI